MFCQKLLVSSLKQDKWGIRIRFPVQLTGLYSEAEQKHFDGETANFQWLHRKLSKCSGSLKLCGMNVTLLVFTCIYIYVYSYKPRVTGRVTGVFESHYCLGTSPAGLQNRFPNLILLFLLMSSANRFAKPINQLTMSAECTRRVQADQDDWPVVIHSLNRYSYAYKYWYIWFYILQ